jgi:hypothetical protein
VVIGNSQLYGGVFKITARACIDDGLLDVCIIKGDSLAEAPLRLFSILRQRYNLDPRIEYHRARVIHIDTRGALPVQVDGDQSGSTPMTFSVAPGALYALLPQTPPADDLLRRIRYDYALPGDLSGDHALDRMRIVSAQRHTRTGDPARHSSAAGTRRPPTNGRRRRCTSPRTVALRP